MIILCMFSTEFIVKFQGNILWYGSFLCTGFRWGGDIAKIHLKQMVSSLIEKDFFYNYLSSKTRRSNAVQKPFVIIGYRNISLDAA